MPAKTPAHQPNPQIEHERLTSLINSMADGVIAVDEKDKVVLYNGATLDILDINSSISDRLLPRVLHLVDKNGQPVDAARLIRDTKKPFSTRELRLQYPDGSFANLYLSIAPVRLGYGQKGMRGHVLLLRDITHEKSLEEERDEFISVVSHELRTPIAIAEGNISNAQFIVDKTGDIKQVKEALKQAYEQITFLSGMINDLSTLSRAERGKLQVDIEDINAYALITELAEEYQPQADSKGLRIILDLDPSLELLKSSKLYVREILQNFLTNALKYTEQGSISIGAHKRQGGIIFSVTDTGIGISNTDREKVFDKFFRSEDYRTKASSGTGLGLYVTMKLARLIHADIDVKSELDKGSTFSIFIPKLERV
jgi:two-component system phosphate regulon sensor histidine kinase PhoR